MEYEGRRFAASAYTVSRCPVVPDAKAIPLRHEEVRRTNTRPLSDWLARVVGMLALAVIDIDIYGPCGAPLLLGSRRRSVRRAGTGVSNDRREETVTDLNGPASLGWGCWLRARCHHGARDSWARHSYSSRTLAGRPATMIP